jgi:hypothetical protein
MQTTAIVATEAALQTHKHTSHTSNVGQLVGSCMPCTALQRLPAPYPLTSGMSRTLNHQLAMRPTFCAVVMPEPDGAAMFVNEMYYERAESVRRAECVADSLTRNGCLSPLR